MASSYSNPYLERLRQTRSGSSTGSSPVRRTLNISPTGSSMSFKPRSSSETDDLAQASQTLDNAEAYNKAIGNEGAIEEAKGEKGFLEKIFTVIGAPASAVVGGLSAAFGMDDNDGDDTNDGVWDRVSASLTGKRRYGAGDFGALQWDEDDSFLEKALKGTGAFVADVALDPLTYVGGVGLLGRGASKIAGSAVKNLDASTIDKVVKALPADSKIFANQIPAPSAASITKSSAADAAGASKQLVTDSAVKPADVLPEPLEQGALFTKLTPGTARAKRAEATGIPVKPFETPETPALALRREALEEADAIAKPVLSPGEEVTSRLSSAAEEGYFMRRGRGVRENVGSTLRELGLSDEVADKLGSEIFSSLDSGVRGGLGVMTPLGRTAVSTRGGGQWLDEIGTSKYNLGGAASKYYDVLNKVRGSDVYRVAANRLGGKDAEIAGRFLRKEIGFDEYKALTNSTVSKMDSISRVGATIATARKAMESVLSADEVDSETARKLASRIWAGEKPEELVGKFKQKDVDAAKDLVQLSDDSRNKIWSSYLALARDTDLVSLNEFKDLEKLIKENHQPRILTKEAAATFNENLPHAAGNQRGVHYNPTTARNPKAGYDAEELADAAYRDPETGELLYIESSKKVPMTNAQANQVAKSEGKDTRFIEDPVIAFNQYTDTLAFRLANLEQIKTLKDANIVRRVGPKHKGGSFTEKNPDGTETKWVSIGGAQVEGKNIASTATRLYVPKHLAPAVNKLLATDIKKANKYIDNFYKPYYTFFKQTATVGRGPGYHIRNGVGIGWMNMIGGVTPKDHLQMGKIMSAEKDARTHIRDYIIKGETKKLAPEHRKLVDDLKASGRPVNLTDLDGLVEQAVKPVLEKQDAGPAGNLYDVWRAMRARRLGEDSILLQDTSFDMANGANLGRDLTRPTMFVNKEPDELNMVERKLDKLVDNWWMSTNARYAQGMEYYGRGAAFLQGAKRFGLKDDGTGADLFAKSLHYDYSDLSDFERNVMKNMLPFYTFMRNNVPTQLHALTKQPGKFNQLQHLQYEAENQFGQRNEEGELVGDDMLPEWVRDRLGFLSDINLGGGNLGVMAENPALDLNKLFNGSGKNLVDWSELTDSTNPLVRTVAESIMAKDMSTGAPLDKPKDSPWYLPFGTSKGPEGQRQQDARIANAVTGLLPAVGIWDRLQPGAVQAAALATGNNWNSLENVPLLGGGESRHATRSATNWGSFLAGAPLMTFDETQAEGEMRNRSTFLQQEASKAAAGQDLDEEEIKEIRQMVRDGYSDELIQSRLEEMRATPIERKRDKEE